MSGISPCSHTGEHLLWAQIMHYWSAKLKEEEEKRDRRLLTREKHYQDNEKQSKTVLQMKARNEGRT